MGNQTVNVKIEVEARTAAANANLDKTAKSAEGAKTQTVGLNKELANYEKAAARASKAATGQGKSFAGLTSATANYDKASDRLIAGNDKMGKSFAGVAKSAYASKDGFGAAKTGLQQLGSVINARIAQLGPLGLAGAVAGAAFTIDQMSQRSLKLRDVQGALTISIDKARAASHGLIDDFTLQQNAVTAVRFGIAKTDKDYAKLVKTATLLARTTGQDSTKAVEDLTTALARQSPMILDNLGLQVNVEAANKAYAASLGKAASALTDTEKKQAFFNAAMADAERKTSGITVATDTWAVKVQKLKVQLVNIGDSLIQLPENVTALRKEMQMADETGSALAFTLLKLSDACEVAGRIGLAALAGGVAEVREEMHKLMPTRTATVGTLGWGDALKKGAVDVAKSQIAATGEGLAVQGGLMASLKAFNDEFEKKERQRTKKNLREAKELAGPKGWGAFADPTAMKIENSRVGRMQRRASGAETFAALDEQFEKSREAMEQAREKAEKDRHETRKLRLEEEREFRKKAHEDEIDRQNELIEQQEASGKIAGDTVAGLAQAWAAAGDLSAKGFKKALAAWGKAESLRLMGVAISEGVQALVSLAFFNYPQAALHGTAAGAATAGAIAIAGLTAATGGLSRSIGSARTKSGGFGADAFGGGSGYGGGGSTTPTSTNSQSDQIPTSSNQQYAQATMASGGSSSGSTQHFGPGSIVVLGAIDNTSALKIAQGIKRAERGLGKTGS